MNVTRNLLITTTLAVLAALASADDGQANGVEFFEKRIRPMLIRHCYECHSAAASEVKGGLRLDSRDLIRNGGESGPAVVPGHPDDSLLLDAIRHESFEMPPDRKLPDQVVADFEMWIKGGATDPRDQPPTSEEISELSWQSILKERRTWWSLQPIDSAVAKVTETFGSDSEQHSQQIDAFVTAKKDAQGVPSAPRAPPRVLARRLSLVLTGLPPAPGVIDQYVQAAGTDPDAAYEQLVDRMLSSPHYGEHWARHWMDVVRFAETHGYEWNHEIRDAWRYRDYLIRAFNSDVPFDQLVREHIAGDLLQEPRLNSKLGINESMIGTAFWRFGELGHDNCVDFPEIRFDALDNQIDTFGKAFQGLTISCARCHDHKIDAISTKDYYGLVGVLEGCTQVVHTIDVPQQNSGVLSQTRQLMNKLRKLLADRWLAAIDQSRDVFASVIADPAVTDSDSNPLAKYITNTNLDLSDPGSILGRLARRDAGDENAAVVQTADLRNAHWLWYPEGNAAVDAPIESRYFRRRVDVPEDRRVTKAWCFFAGDDRVSLFVNGMHLGAGTGHPMLVGVDLAEQLKVGANELAVINTNQKADVKQNPGGWIGVIRIEFESGDPLLVYSDSNWSSARSVQEGWQTRSFEDDTWVPAMQLCKAGIGPWGYPWPAQSRVQRKVSLASVWSTLKKEYRVEQDRRAKFNAENFEVWTDFGAAKESGWTASGLGLASGPNRPGEFTLTRHGDQIVAAIVPAGLYTNVTSDRLNGSLRSPWLPTDRKYISVQVTGERRSMVRAVVDSCALNEFAGGGLSYLTDGATKWHRFPCSTGGERRSLIELATRADNPRWPDRPDRAGSKDPTELADYRSYFGVTQAVLHDTAATPLTELTPVLPLFTETNSAGKAAIVQSFQTVAHGAILAWQEGRATDDDVHWLNWLLQTRLVPNSAQGDEQIIELVKQYRSIEQKIREPRVIAGLADHGSGRGFPVLKGGDPSQPGNVVPPRYIEVIADISQPFDSVGSGRRELAEIIASSDNPLTARVMVNRVWHHLFGTGIVTTPDDFGGMGEKPTHPELLDFLAAGFARDGWSVKRLIRRIVLSQTFQQSSHPDELAAQLDPGNQLLHHFPARRLDAESIRDTILTVSGRLDRTQFGPGIQPHREREIDYRKLWSGPLDGEGRRSIYTKVTRMEGPQFLELFDFPNPMATRGNRDRTNVPAQALALLNDPFVIDQAGYWADRLVSMDHDSIGQRIHNMFQHALGRSPTKTEQQRFNALVRQLADDDVNILLDTSVWQDAAHAVFNLKELIYIW